MDEQTVIDLLNGLLELECRSLITRLGQAQPFVGWANAQDLPVLQGIVAQQDEHIRRLTGALGQLGAVPRPMAAIDTRTAGIHYLDVQYLLPRVVAETQRLIDAYQRAAGQLPAGSVAATVAEIADGHRRHLAQLQAMLQRVA